MDAPQDISMKTEEVLRVELEVLRHEHRDLDALDERHGPRPGGRRPRRVRLVTRRWTHRPAP